MAALGKIITFLLKRIAAVLRSMCSALISKKRPCTCFWDRSEGLSQNDHFYLIWIAAKCGLCRNSWCLAVCYECVLQCWSALCLLCCSNESRPRALINDFHLPNSNRGGRRTIKLSSSNKTICKRCVRADARQMYVCLYVSIKTVLYTEYTEELVS